MNLILGVPRGCAGHVPDPHAGSTASGQAPWSAEHIQQRAFARCVALVCAWNARCLESCLLHWPTSPSSQVVDLYVCNLGFNVVSGPVLTCLPNSIGYCNVGLRGLACKSAFCLLLPQVLLGVCVYDACCCQCFTAAAGRLAPQVWLGLPSVLVKGP